MDLTETARRVSDVIGRKFRHKLDVDSLAPDTPLFSGTALASVDAIELVVALEDEFGVFFDDDELDVSRLQTVAAITEVVDKLLDRPRNGPR
ncbi:MAG: acyl carrier protein [Actinobacteria bacterium]|nr:acyl carrier protein [Actinomycetota bacterium]